MAHIRDLLAAGRTFSFEFFPPKTDEALRGLEKTLHELEGLRPSFVSAGLLAFLLGAPAGAAGGVLLKVDPIV